MAPLTLPFAHLNLRINPFGEATSAERAKLAVVDLTGLAEILRTGGAVEFVGDHGRGKSTHLLALHAAFPNAPFVKLEDVRDVAPAPVLFVDEIERVRNREVLFRRCGALAIGAHASQGAGLRAARHAVRSINVGGMSLERLRKIIERRIEWARRGPGRIPGVSDNRLRLLIARHGDDARSIEGELYDLFQTLPEAGDALV